jgi:hypothetical protein
MPTYKHDPQAVLDYSWDWTNWLVEGDSIASYSLTPPTGVTIVSHSRDEAVVTAFMSVGEVIPEGESAVRLGITCHVTTTEGREDDRTLHLLVIER